MKRSLVLAFVVAAPLALLSALGLAAATSTTSASAEPPLGLPPVPYPADNPQTPEKIALGEQLFNDTRFSSTGSIGTAATSGVTRPSPRSSTLTHR